MATTNPGVAPQTGDDQPGAEDVEIDHEVAHAARMYDYLAGGTTHFEVDRQAVERASVAVGGMENARADVRANRAFLGRVVQWLVGPCGIRQFLDIGTGVPGPGNVDAVAHEAAPGIRVVCVDNDPIVLAHAHRIGPPGGRGVTAFVAGDLRDPDHLLEAAARTLDLGQPVALLLISVLHLIEDDDDPYGIVRGLVDALAPASYLALSHLTADIAPKAMRALVNALNASARERFVMRDHAEVSRFFDGLEVIRPGVVQVDQWHAGRLAPPPSDAGWVPSFYGGVARTSVWPAPAAHPLTTQH